MRQEIEMPNITNFAVNPIEDDLNLLKYRLHTLLSTNEVEVTFTKVDGTERRMYCTLCPSLMPSDISFSETSHRKPSDDVLVVWDLAKNDWRSFRIDSVRHFIALRSEDNPVRVGEAKRKEEKVKTKVIVYLNTQGLSKEKADDYMKESSKRIADWWGNADDVLILPSDRTIVETVFKE